ncbi:MAG: tungstate ABC transporter substrate-binding protein WtpA [Chloroflexi bacterium CG07_land_8_20_14_0_80_51_10]|nr:MAG: tungstate ABC transporter substrate-binding protein WtpA [Chloroflexi bacterium CG07_land_8_20_14_0_80_51_10]
MKGKTLKIVSIALALVLMLTLMVGCGEAAKTTPTLPPTLKGTITIFHAGSLAVPFKEMEKEFETLHPGVDVQCESASSGVAIRKVTELGKNAEIVASSEYSLIPDLMFPEFADWYMTFAKNRMVLCYTDESKYADEVNSDNWFDILLRDGVEYGHSTLLDPCGYRTLLVWQLAEKHHNQPGLYDQLLASCPEKNIRPKAVELVALLQSGALDYASEYSSVAMQHKLKYVEFPPEIDLSSVEFKDFYAQSIVDIPGKEPGTTITKKGEPIVYGVTIPKNTANPELAIAFMEYLLGEKGQAIMNKNGQPSIVPAVVNDLSKLPAELKPFAVEAEK